MIRDTLYNFHIYNNWLKSLKPKNNVSSPNVVKSPSAFLFFSNLSKGLLTHFKDLAWPSLAMNPSSKVKTIPFLHPLMNINLVMLLWLFSNSQNDRHSFLKGKNTVSIGGVLTYHGFFLRFDIFLQTWDFSGL